jgi:hypothetical protein
MLLKKIRTSLLDIMHFQLMSPCLIHHLWACFDTVDSIGKVRGSEVLRINRILISHVRTHSI